MLIPLVRVRLLLPFCFLVTVSLLSLTLFSARICLGQEKPPQNEEQRQARDALNNGVQNFRSGQIDQAINEFAHAKQLDPQLVNARLYLGTAYASLYIPGAPSEENRRKGESAIEEYRGVLTLQPDNLSAVDGIGSILFQMAGQPFNPDKFAESKSFHLKHIQIKPDDPEPYYWVGVIDWTLAFRANGEMRASYNSATKRHQIRDTDPLPAVQREEYLRTYGPTIEEGIQALKQAIQLRPDYDDAMAYLNLLYRRKADTVTGNSEREQLMKMADDLIDRIKETKQKRATSLPS